MKKTIVKGMIGSLLMAVSTLSHAGDIKMTVFGSGGIVVDETTGKQSVCPKSSTLKCADVIIKEGAVPDQSGHVWAKVVLTNGQVHFIRVAMPSQNSSLQAQ